MLNTYRLPACRLRKAAVDVGHCRRELTTLQNTGAYWFDRGRDCAEFSRDMSWVLLSACGVKENYVKSELLTHDPYGFFQVRIIRKNGGGFVVRIERIQKKISSQINIRTFFFSSDDICHRRTGRRWIDQGKRYIIREKGSVMSREVRKSFERPNERTLSQGTLWVTSTVYLSSEITDEVDRIRGAEAFELRHRCSTT